MKRILCLVCFLAILLCLPLALRAEALLSVCLNEVCASNGGHYTVGGASPDYIELRNLTDQPIALDGLFISNDEDHPQKFSLEGYTIPENGYLILAADKKELPFKLSASGGEELLLSDAEGNVLQRVTLPPLEKDETYSLQPGGEWQLTDPSPLGDNPEGVPYVKKVYVASPRFSHEAGFYDEPFDLTLEGYKTYRLYYTTDGSVPDENSTPYTGPIHIEDATNQPNGISMRTDITISDATPPSAPVKKATIIRAVAIDPDGNRSNDVVKAYFVGFQNDETYLHIPILSIVADPDLMFDAQDGVYVRGKVYQEWLNDENRDQEMSVERIPANYKMRGREWEIPVDIQWFDAENALQLSQGAGLRIHGDWSRENAKKSFNLYARKEYGGSVFQYGILAGLEGKEKLVVRTNLARDALVHALLQETGLPVSLCTPCLTFINGEFWGMYEIRDKQDVKDIASFFGLKKEDLIVVKNQEIIAGTTPDEIADKTAKGIHKYLIAQMSKLDASTPQGYQAINELLDVDNYITQMAGNAFLNNTDTSYRHNYTIWRTAEKKDNAYQDGRWRWIFQDMDMCCYSYEGVRQMILSLPEDVIFSSLWKNSEFQTKFLTRIMDFANVELTPEYVEDFITPILTYYNSYLKETYVRFPGKSSSIANPGQKQISELTAFFKTRRSAVIEQLTETFQLTRGTSTIALQNLPEGIALTINGHEAHLYGDAWTGVYFKGCAVSVAAGEIPGCQFVGWYEGEKLLTAEKTVEIFTDGDRALTPVYEELPTLVRMNQSDILYGSGTYGFTKQLQDSYEECVLQPDAGVDARRDYVNNAMQFQMDAAAQGPLGFTLSFPMRHYESGGAVFTLSVPDDAASLQWKALCKNGEGAYQELPSDCAALTGGLLRISFTIPKERLEEQAIVLRLEAAAEKYPASFSLRSFRVWGVPMDASMAEAHDYDKVAKAIGAEAQYQPDFDKMAGWSAEEIDAEIISLRSRLQSKMARRAVTAVGALEGASPSWEGLENYPAIVIDEKLIRAFYNEDDICLPVSADSAVRLYEAEGDALTFQGMQMIENGTLTMRKRAGVYFLLDQPVEDIRFGIAFDEAPIPASLLSGAFFDIEPRDFLWMEIEARTRYQEETAIELPESWQSRSAYVYRVRGDILEAAAEKIAADDELRMTPAAGRYILLGEPSESFAQQAEWLRQEIADQKRIREKEEKQRAQMKKTLVTAAGAALAVIAVGAGVAAVRHWRRKKRG